MKNPYRRLMTAFAMLVFSLTMFSASTSFAQQEDDPPPPPRDDRPNAPMQERRDGDLISQLNLTPEQINQIREIRQQSAEEWRQTRQRMGRAQRALDEAVYSDTVNEAEIETRARDFGAAQAALARFRALTELRIRRVLTPEQLKTLRELREAAIRNNGQRRRDARDEGSAFDERRPPNRDQRRPDVIRPQIAPNVRGTRP
jgi:Spy/CpxP family protein refolding chaperone